jgi:preprotein translocase subunit SecG
LKGEGIYAIFNEVRLIEGGIVMEIVSKIILAIISVGLILVVLLQSGKSAGLSGIVGGGAEHLMGKAKARGFDAFLGRVTVVLAVLFMLMALVVGYFIK